MQGDEGMVDQALKELESELGVKLANLTRGKGQVHLKARTAREIHHHPAQGLIKRHIGVPIAADATFVPHRLGNRLTQGDANVFHGVVSIDVQVPNRLDLQIDQAVSGNLVQHVIKKSNACGELGDTCAIQIEFDFDLRLRRLTTDFSGSGLGHGQGVQSNEKKGCSAGTVSALGSRHQGRVQQGLQGSEQRVVLAVRTHRDSQTAAEQWVHCRDVLDQHPMVFQAFEDVGRELVQEFWVTGWQPCNSGPNLGLQAHE